MKIAVIASLFPPFDIGGAEQLAAQLALAMHRAGHQVAVVSTCRRDDLPAGRCYRTDTWEGIPVWRIAPWNLYWRFDQHKQRPNRLIRAGWHAIDLWNPSVFRPLRQVLDQIQPDVVNTHNIDGFSPAVWQVAHRYTRSIVHTLHDYHLICPRATMQRPDGVSCNRLCHFCRVYAHYHHLFQSNVSVLVAPGQAIADLHRQAGWSGTRITIIPNGLDAGAIQPPDVPATAPLRILFLSRLEREKGCETLLRVLPLFRESTEFQFHIAGRGSYEGRFTELAERMPHVIWHGFVTGQDKHELFLNTDVFLQLSECRENAPLSLIEAKLYGLYLVGTAIGSIPEIVDTPDAGQLIPPGDREQLFRTLQALQSQKVELRDRRRERLQRNQGYGTREMAEKYLNLFRAALGFSS